MVVLNRIYTRTGDAGTTGLGNGERRLKFDLRIEAYGTVDETNAAIGMARLATGGPSGDAKLEAKLEAKLDAMLAAIQNDLFDLGADLCTPVPQTPPAQAQLRVAQTQVDRLEREIDDLNSALKPLRSFVLPGGSAAAAALHVARTVCRRTERLMVQLAQQPGESVGEPALKYINRLSDFLFVASRYANAQGAGDVLWVPGKNR